MTSVNETTAPEPQSAMPMGWKTILGAVIAVLGFLSQPEVLGLMPERIAAIVQAAGALLAVFGFRAAQAKVIAATNADEVVKERKAVRKQLKRRAAKQREARGEAK